MNALDAVSLLLEAIVVFLALKLAVVKKKSYGYCIALTFAIYVFYDAVRFLTLHVDQIVTSALFLIGSTSILWAVWKIYEE